jgi:hypothetical protein
MAKTSQVPLFVRIGNILTTTLQKRQEAPAASQGEPQAEREELRLLPSTFSAIDQQ